MVFTSAHNSNESHRKFVLVVDGDQSSSAKIKALL